MMLELEDKDSNYLRFGKYRGKTPLQLAVADPSYVVWMYRQINPKPCSKALAQDCLLEIKARKQAETERMRSMDSLSRENAMIWLDATTPVRMVPPPLPIRQFTNDF